MENVEAENSYKAMYALMLKCKYTGVCASLSMWLWMWPHVTIHAASTGTDAGNLSEALHRFTNIIPNKHKYWKRVMHYLSLYNTSWRMLSNTILADNVNTRIQYHKLIQILNRHIHKVYFSRSLTRKCKGNFKQILLHNQSVCVVDLALVLTWLQAFAKILTIAS